MIVLSTLSHLNLERQMNDKTKVNDPKDYLEP